LQQDRGLNTRIAHDLLSNASRVGEVGDLKEFAIDKGNAAFDHNKTILDKEKLS